MNALHRRRRSVTLAAAGVAAVVGTGLFAAVPASAHTPQWSVDCSTVTVDLKDYSSEPTNTVTVKADGKDLLNEKFGGKFHKKLELADHSKPVKVQLIVKANDGDQHNRNETKTAPVCDDQSPEPEPTPTPTDTPSQTPSPSESSTPPASDAPSSSAPAGEEPAPSTSEPSSDLAETGSSNSTPIIAGIAAAVVLIGGALLMLARKRRSTQP